MSFITEFALRNSRLVIILIFVVFFGGIYVFLSYPKQEDPSIVIREAVVTAAFPGMSTQRVEDLITRKLEEKIREIPQVKEIKSDSKIGISILHVIVKDQYKDLVPIWQDLRNKMNDIRSELPNGTIGPIVNDEFGSITRSRTYDGVSPVLVRLQATPEFTVLKMPAPTLPAKTTAVLLGLMATQSISCRVMPVLTADQFAPPSVVLNTPASSVDA